MRLRSIITIAVLKYAAFLDFLGRLLLWPFRRPLSRTHQKLDQLLFERPGFWGNIWRLFHRPDWQRSAKFNTRMWVTGFMIFYPVANFEGHALKVNILVTSSLDLIVYLFHKKRLWPERKVGYWKSYATWYCFTATTFLLNTGLAWVLLNQVQFGKVRSKALLGIIGVIANPWIFKFRDEVALRNRKLETETA